jgi:two-component system, NarL family, response regulator DevR
MKSRDGRQIRVVIVEDHRIVAEALASLLSTTEGIDVVARVHDQAELTALPPAVDPTVVLMDFRLRDGLGVDAVGWLRARWPQAAVVFLSADESEASMLAAARAGAAGYLIKTGTTSQLASAVRAAAAGQTLFSAAQLARYLLHGQEQEKKRLEADRQARERHRLWDELTERERSVLVLIVAGMDNKSIARRLMIGTGTVRAHVQHVLEKLGVHSKLEAAAFAVDRGLTAQMPAGVRHTH